MSSFKMTLTAGAVTLAVIALLWFSMPSIKGYASKAPAQPQPSQSHEATPAAVSTTSLTIPQHTTGVTPTNYKKALRTAADYWAFAHSMLPAAKAGDADAEYYLSRVMEQCDEDNRMYFQHRGQKLTLDEGLQFAVKRHLSIEVAQSVFDRCHGFASGDSAELGNAPEWLAKATDAGQPLAEATTARKLLTQAMMNNFVKSGGQPEPSSIPVVINEAGPRQLLSAAVKSEDPEVLFTIGESQNLLFPASSDTDTARYAWWLVACQRGLDCTGAAEWVKNACAGDPQCASADNPTDLVRTLSGDKWPDVQQRAQEISAELGAAQWDKLGLGS